ncbi:family with sequence similarity 213, member [Seminavis robusta]|uniref:Peroxiredoxin-like 2A n=1 Tax=Seminavis robusta TaxID=568900 RepID=A0A9N8H6S1_9STRA|nr:family with sequence similarity 213, member [Seminavis robusta]|eukprot:Sro120_g058460.1 family with sequence similarity 213, member (265) ;mRNA; r:48590-49384
MSTAIISNLPQELPHELGMLKVRESASTSATEASDTSERTDGVDESYKVKTKALYNIPLRRVNPSFGVVNVANSTTDLKSMTIKERRDVGANVTVLFAVRTPGCAGCREHGLQLSELAKQDKKIALVGAVKEAGVDDQALVDFYEEYFHHPMYKDDHWKIFHAMGGKKVCKFQLMKRAYSLFRRTRGKGIESNVGCGDFWTKGGVMIFNKKGELKYTQYERFGKEFDMDAIRKAIQQIRSEQRKQMDSSATTHTSSATQHAWDW